jgi:hypothetical protein
LALAGSRSSIHDMGYQLYSDEKGAEVFFTLSAGFPQNTYFISMPLTSVAAQSSKNQ